MAAVECLVNYEMNASLCGRVIEIHLPIATCVCLFPPRRWKTNTEVDRLFSMMWSRLERVGVMTNHNTSRKPRSARSAAGLTDSDPLQSSPSRRYLRLLIALRETNCILRLEKAIHIVMPSSHRRHGQDKTALSCSRRRCEQNWRQV